ncbi:MAG: TolC family protein, partial [Bacteroidales bacterium]
MRKISIISFAITAIFSGSMLAQTQSWDMDDCMSFAVQNSSKIKVQELLNRNYKEDRKASVGALFPSVNAGVGATSSFGRSIDPETNTYSNISNFSNAYEIGGNMSLFQAGALLNAVKVSKVTALMGIEEQQRKQDDISIQTMQAFADYLYYIECVKLSDEKLKQSEQLLYKTKRMESMGLKSQADVAQVVAQVAADDYTLTKQNNLRDQSLLTLKQAMNYPLRDSLAVDTNLLIPLYLPDDRSPEELYQAARFWNPSAKVA